ncbi:hypothetical protein GCM10009534_74080 [Kribbella sandramycini]|uniref:Uncharacterized protein n=1 Tax=Kribbella sandramycini TaxID=60450 RepID=A0A841S4X2_9ACTN|nr:hypothetical protein [Kribbella sandramycini]
MRRLSVLVDALPRESATARAMHGELADWSTEAVLLADVWSALTGERHPALPKKSTRRPDADQARAALMAQRARLQEDPQ